MERKKEENYIKKGKKALKCIFLGYELNKNFTQKRGEGKNDQNAQNISLYVKMTFPRLDNEYSLTKFRRSAVWGKFIRLFTGQGLNDPAKGVGQLRPVRVRI